MKKKNLIKWGVLNMLVLPLAAQESIVLQPDSATGKDAFIDELNPNTNFGYYQDFISYSWTFSGVEGLGNSLLQFDLSQIPANCVITDAKLSLYHNSITTSAGQYGNNACHLKKITTYWDENTVTWNTAPGTTTAGQVYLRKSPKPDQDYPGIDLTDMAKKWYANPSSNNGLMLDLIDKALFSSLKFCSSDHADPAKRPLLIIKYDRQVGINSTEKEALNYFVHPNPVHDQLIITVTALPGDFTFIISDPNGKEVLRELVQSRRKVMDLSKLSSGVYYTKLITGQSVFSGKIIKE